MHVISHADFEFPEIPAQYLFSVGNESWSVYKEKWYVNRPYMFRILGFILDGIGKKSYAEHHELNGRHFVHG